MAVLQQQLELLLGDMSLGLEEELACLQLIKQEAQ